MFKARFLAYLSSEKNYSKRTVASYFRDLKQFEGFLGGKENEDNLLKTDQDDVRSWIIQLMNDGCKATTVNRKLSSLRSFFHYLLKIEAISKDPTALINGPKKRKPLPVFMKESQMDLLLSQKKEGLTFEESRDFLIIEMFYLTGMRLAELISLRVQDVDFSRMLLKVHGKRNKERLIPFGKELEQSMKNYLELRKQQSVDSSTCFFVRTNGDPLYPSLVYRIVRRELAKVTTQTKRSPHVLRHTFATAMLNNDAELSVVKEILGHSSLTATEVYTHTTFEELKKVYKQAHPRA